jgi:hypothetical protein
MPQEALNERRCMMARLWNLRLNLDEFNAALAGLFDDEERSHFLMGFAHGINGGSGSRGEGAFCVGFDLGYATRQEALGFSEKKRQGGIKSAAARTQKTGSANVVLEHNLNTTLAQLEHNSDELQRNEVVFEPIYNLQSTELQTTELQTQRARRSRKQDKLEGYPEELKAMLTELHSLWPTHRENGDKIQFDKHRAIENAYQLIKSDHRLTVELLRSAAMSHLEEKGNWATTIPNFFGPVKQTYVPYVRLLLSKASS